MGNASYSIEYVCDRDRLNPRRQTYADHGGSAQIPKEITEVMNGAEFNFIGGAEKGKTIVKFFCFPNVFGDEMFLSEACKKGYIQRVHGNNYRIVADIKYFKIFYKQYGNEFGVEDLYQSFFFELDSKAEYEHTIWLPYLELNAVTPWDWKFRARGKFMKDEAIKKHFSKVKKEGEKSSYFFYKIQMPLSLSILKQMVSRVPVSASGIPIDPNEYFRVIR